MRAREAAAAESPIPVQSFEPSDELVAELRERRSDLDFSAVLDRFRRHRWKRRRTVAEWSDELRGWFGREDLPDAAPSARRNGAWYLTRIRTLTAFLSPEALQAQLSNEPETEALIAELGGIDMAGQTMLADVEAALRRVRSGAKVCS